jgi:hypothetical protein
VVVATDIRVDVWFGVRAYLDHLLPKKFCSLVVGKCFGFIKRQCSAVVTGQEFRRERHLPKHLMQQTTILGSRAASTLLCRPATLLFVDVDADSPD